jgi:hypothetical protein
MLPDPRRILLDVASRLVSFHTPPVDVLKTGDLRLGKVFDAAGAAIAVDISDDLQVRLCYCLSPVFR